MKLGDGEHSFPSLPPIGTTVGIAKYHDHDATVYVLIPQVRSNPHAQQVCVNEDKSDVDQREKSEWQMVRVGNRAKK